MVLFGHHTQSYLGIEIEVNGKTFPDGTTDHVLVFGALVLLVYGLYAAVRDFLRWRRQLAKGPREL